MSKKSLFISLIILLLIPAVGSAKFSSYKKVLKKWSRSDKVFRSQDLQAIIIWNATLLNDQMLSSQADQFEKIYDSSQAERNVYYQKLLQKRDDSIFFFVSFYSDSRKFGDLKNPRSKWNVTLEAGGQTFEPLRIEKVKSPNPLQQKFFPYLSPWAIGYYIWFPLAAGNYSLPYSLSVHGPFGASSLSW